jgi:hypothetical protein
MKLNAKQWSLLDNDPRKKISKRERPKLKKSRIVMPVRGAQLTWALIYHPEWVMEQLEAGK